VMINIMVSGERYAWSKGKRQVCYLWGWLKIRHQLQAEWV
jgi:hypothetical protein